MEEITPEDIEKKYTEEETKIVRELLISCIEIINNLLQNRYKEMMRRDYLLFSLHEDLSLSDIGDRRDALILQLGNFYTSWNVKGDWYGGTYYIEFAPKTPFRKDLNIDISDIKKEKEEVTPDSVITDRSEILDIRTEE